MAEAKVGTEGMSTEEALEAFAKGSAAGWQKEVKQAIVANKSRGRGRGVPPMDYRCPRCDAYGEHWLPECPTHGDPAFDRKRVRPPVGIPMTRLARSEEGGLVLPDGNTGTLVANEDAFAREVLGIGSLVANEEPAAEGAAQLPGVQQEQQQQPGIKLMSTAETLATANKAATTAGTAAGPIGFVPFSVAMIRGGNVPRLAGRVDGERAERKKGKGEVEGEGEGEEKDENFDVNAAKDALIGAMDPQDERLFELMRSQMLPIGPRDFLIEAYDREAAMGKDAFEAAQKKAREAREAERGNGAGKGRSESEGRGRDSRERVERERVVRARSRSRSPIERERRRGVRDARMKQDRYERDRERDRERNRERNRERDRERDRERERDRDRDRDRRRSGGKDDDVVFTISNSKGKSGRDSKSRDRSRDKSRDRSRDRRDERPRDRYYDRDRRDENRDRRDERRDRRDERRDRRDDRSQSGGAKPRSALDVARALKEKKEKREEETKAPRRTMAPKERTAQEDRRASMTSRDSAGQPKKTGKHAPIVWTEKGVDEIVDYGDSE